MRISYGTNKIGTVINMLSQSFCNENMSKGELTKFIICQNVILFFVTIAILLVLQC